MLGYYRSPSPAPRSFKRQEKTSTNDNYNTEEKRNEAKAKELQRVNCDKQQKKILFSREISGTSSLPGQYLKLRHATMQDKTQHGRTHRERCQTHHHPKRVKIFILFKCAFFYTRQHFFEKTSIHEASLCLLLSKTL